jgi:hypothetical protein
MGCGAGDIPDPRNKPTAKAIVMRRNVVSQHISEVGSCGTFPTMCSGKTGT